MGAGSRKQAVHHRPKLCLIDAAAKQELAPWRFGTFERTPERVYIPALLSQPYCPGPPRR